MRTVSVAETRKNLSSLLTAVAVMREEIIITRHGKPLAKLVACTGADSSAALHPLRGLPLDVPEDFDEPLPDVWEASGE